MGVVIKQSLRATVHLYIGIVVGFITAIVVFPRVFSPEQIGLLNILMQISLLVSQFGIFGMPGVITYYFPHFRDKENGHNGFPIVILLGTAIGCFLSTLFIFVFKSWIISKYPNPLFVEHYNQLVILTIASIMFINLDSYYKGFYNVVLATFLKETLQRILMLLGVGLFMVGIVGFDFYVVIYSLSVVLPSVWLFLSIARDGHFPMKPKWSFITPGLRTGMITVGIFNVLASMSTYINVGIDRIMISSLGGLEAGGIYATTILFGTLVSVPSRTVKKITAALFAEGWKDDDLDKISDIYRKSCLTQFIIGLMIFICIWCNIDNILKVLPPEYAAGKWAIFWGCVTNLMEMLTGAASSLIGTSKHYKTQTYQGIMLVAIIIGANYLFIPIMGISGAAFATAVSFFLFNSFRHFYIVYRWKMQPLGMKELYVLMLAIVCYAFIYIIPTMGYFIVDAAARGTIAVAFFGGLVYYFKISPEINTATNAVIKKIPVINKVIGIK